MTKKCIGCGVLLQSSVIDKEGYTTSEDSTLCERCFRIKHYSDYKAITKTNEEFTSILESIDSKSLVVLVLDIFSLPEDLKLITNILKNPILLVLTKRDILPKRVYDVRLLEYVNNYKLNFVDKIIVSSFKNYNFDELLHKINKHKTNDKVYFAGYTNAGKSTLINKLMYNYSGEISSITTSPIPSTTINNIEVKFNKDITLIDTPGFIRDGNIEQVVSSKELKLISPSQTIKPTTYQIKGKQFLYIDSYANVEISNNNITIFASNKLKIERLYKNKENDDFNTYEFDMKASEDLVISGLCFIKFTKNEKIKVSVLKNVKPYTRKSLI